jgi:hypothetical protein
LLITGGLKGPFVENHVPLTSQEPIELFEETRIAYRKFNVISEVAFHPCSIKPDVIAHPRKCIGNFPFIEFGISFGSFVLDDEEPR